MSLSTPLVQTTLVGLGATLLMDAWLALLRRLGVQALDIALIGRWIGHMSQGRFKHRAIAQASPVPDERLLGWAAHYATGVAFAALLVGIAGVGWLRQPTPLPSIAMGVATVTLPYFVMQPAMGAGIAASNTARPMQNRLRSLANHIVFGLGLYLSALLAQRFA